MRRADVIAASLLAAIALFAIACGGPAKPPARAVIESDLDGWSFRRYQELLDVEVWVKNNPAVAHTASYARLAAEKRGHVADADVVNAVVTRYQHDDDAIARALVVFARRLAQDASYKVEEKRVGDVRLFMVKGGGEAWAMWAAKRHVVKIGGPGRDDVPAAVIEGYGERYPSRLTSGSLDGPLPEGPAEPAPKREPFDPDNPSPDWDHGKKKTGR